MSCFRLICAILLVAFSAAASAQENRVTDPLLDSLLSNPVSATEKSQLASAPVSAAAKYKQTLIEAPASISVITSADIERFHYTTLAEILNRVRGFYTSNDRNYSYAGIRGFSRPTDFNNRILLLIDGHTLNEDVYGSALLGSEFGVSLDAIDRIEIVRGPGSALYGTGAMFGVVNVITKDFHSAEYVRVTGSLGSYGYQNASLLFGKEFARGSGIFLSANIGRENGTDIYFPEYDTDSTHHGIASGLDWDHYYGLTAKITLPHFIIRSGFTSREKGIATASYFTRFNDPGERTLDTRQFIDALCTIPVRHAMEISVRLYGDRYHYAGAFPYEELLTDQSTGLWWGSEMRVQWDIASNDRLVAGVEYQDHRHVDYILSNGGIESFNLNKPFSVHSLYAQDEFQWFENLSLIGGVRYDKYTARAGMLTPRIAVNWNAFEGGVIKFLVGESFRSPNFYELYYIEPTAGYKDNPSLSPELMTTWELALEQRISDHLEASVSLYRYAMKNLIDPVLDPADSLINFQNLSEITARGIEVEVEYRPNRRVHCYGLFSTQVAENRLSQTTLTNSPVWLARAGTSFKLRSWLEASVEGSFDSDRMTVYGTTSPSFALLHAALIVTPRAHSLTITVGVRNVLDAHYSTPGGYEHVQPVIPQMGRQLILKTAYSF